MLTDKSWIYMVICAACLKGIASTLWETLHIPLVYPFFYLCVPYLLYCAMILWSLHMMVKHPRETWSQSVCGEWYTAEWPNCTAVTWILSTLMWLIEIVDSAGSCTLIQNHWNILMSSFKILSLYRCPCSADLLPGWWWCSRLHACCRPCSKVSAVR